MDDRDERFMRRALELARVPPFTSPNPRVGAVLVDGTRTVGEGFHAGPGSPHAEVLALRGGDGRGATLYVSLEPCVHHGLTPPCGPAIVAAGIARVVVACVDPDRRVDGRGIAYLRSAGVEVTEGVSADEARLVNAAYIHHRTTGRAYLTLKLALSLDGRLAAPDGSSRWITGPGSRRWVHERRVEADCVLVGAGTVLADDPTLTARAVDASRQPVKVIVDAAGRVPPSASLFRDGYVVVATSQAPHELQTKWKETGAEVVVVPGDDRQVDVAAVLDELGRRGIVEVYCEGGARLATYLLRNDLVERLELYYGAVTLGAGGPEIGDLGTASIEDARRWETLVVDRVGDDALVVLRRARSVSGERP